MSGSFKTEAVVLRSIRLGEADRVLHLYSAGRGRIGAVAKGVRRTRSRFGGRLEPFSRVSLILHEGRGELQTVTSAQTVDAYPRLRGSAASLEAAASACGAVLRLLDSAEANPPAYNLLCRYLSLLDDAERIVEASAVAGRLAFRIKLALTAGFAPELGGCARCGDREHLSGFSGAAGGMVCEACGGEGFPLSEEAHGFMVSALGRPLSELPDAGQGALRQVERAISETLEHHAHVRLRPAA
jgi:DNA repair protein RecO (recombination protein O)